jgi:hypothetical protein
VGLPDRSDFDLSFCPQASRSPSRGSTHVQRRPFDLPLSFYIPPCAWHPLVARCPTMGSAASVSSDSFATEALNLSDDKLVEIAAQLCQRDPARFERIVATARVRWELRVFSFACRGP